jgi:DNA-binding winged helix-turn-helix (wHTH) protein/tetratricopeptide (TPR) repeat protein
MTRKSFRFESFTLDLERLCLHGPSGQVDLRRKSFEVLRYLIDHAGRVVTKEELIKAIWPDVTVSDESLTQCISEIRRAIGDGGQRIIKTVPRRGYLINVAVSTGDTRPAQASQVSTASTPVETAAKIDGDILMGERKHATVLCADFRESLELIARRDPEEALKILDAVLKLMTHAVHRYDGTVNLVTGYGIVALFGVPLTHEDHAVRACYAALQIREEIKRYAQGLQHSPGVPIQVHAGMNSGEVVTRAIASDPRSQYRAMGEATDIAARLAQMAPLGTLLISAETLRLSEGHVQVKTCELANINALGEPLYELVGAGPAQTRFQALAARGLTSFVGRSAEIEQLLRVQARAQRGHGQIAAIVGEAGVGKSRLVYELAHSHHLQGWLTLESASVSFGKTTSYLPVIDLLKDYFKIQERDHTGEIREKVRGKLLTLDEALKPNLTALLALLDVPVDDTAWGALDPGQRRQRTLDAVRRLLLREARKQPVLLIFEDLHWIDGETQALLDSLVDSLGAARLLLLVNYRPEYQHGWGSKTSYSQLRLDALPAESAGDLLDALLGDDHGLAPLKERLVKRGNPFFLEETVRTLVETRVLAGERGRHWLTQPIQTIRVPPTVQAMLAARIDRLPTEDKRLLQVASVIGKDVPFVLLQAIADLSEKALRLALERLQAAEFLDETGLFPDLEYSFKHALTHEVAYGGLLQEHRRELHARIVGAIETLHRDRLAEQIERLAHHAFLGELREKAVGYLRQAGLKAAARSALLDARVGFDQALGILDVLPESPSTLEQAFEIRLELRPVLILLGELRPVLERLREAEVLAERLNDERRRGQVCALVTNTHSLLGDLDEAVASGTSALEIAGRLGGLRLRILAASYLEQAHYFRGEYERVIELATDNLAVLPADRVYENFGLPSPVSVWVRFFLVMSLAELGRFAEAAVYEAEAIRLAEPTHHAFTVGQAHWAAATLHLLKGDWVEACSLIERWIAEVRTGNVVIVLPWAIAPSAWVLAQLGERSESLNRLREGKQLLERQVARGIFGHRGWAYHSLGHASLVLGLLDEARNWGDLALESSPCHPGYAAHALHLLGDIATHPDRFDAESGETRYREALALAELRGMRPLVAHCRLGLGKLSGRTGKRARAQEHLTTAATMYRDMDMTFWLERAKAEINILE